MGDRINEMKGNVKKDLGNVTGDKDMQAEGEAERDTAHASREAKGVGNQVKGSIKEAAGELTGNEETRARGAADKLKGDAQRAG